MKRLLLSTLLGLLPLVAAAQTEPGQSMRMKEYQIELPTKVYRMYPGDFDTYKGVYDLSNGDTMVLRAIGRRIYAEVGKRPRTEMVAAAPNVFVAIDRQLKLTLEDGISGEVTGELIMVVPRQPTQANAAGVEVIRLMANR